MYRIFSLLVIVLLTSCQNSKTEQKLEVGTYRASLQLDKNVVLPFIFEVNSDFELIVLNAEERITVDEITYKNDSVYIKTPVFEGYIAAVFEGKNLKGSFINESLNRVVPFEAKFNETNRFAVSENPFFNIEGNWETTFSKGIEADQYMAKAIFKQQGSKVIGTFRTATGDYRFLEGVVSGNQLQLSAFDGAHAFLFTATVSDSKIEGTFYSGNHWQEPFEAERNPDFELTNPEALTYLKDGYERLAFSFPDEDGTIVSLADDRFKNKVVVVQIMGTWCPNCLDESKFYTDFYNANTHKDFEIVGLAFEYAKTSEKAFKSIARLKQKLNIAYPILLAQHGSSNKTKAQEKLPMLNHVLSYPTSIFIDKKGNVRKIHTGFNGPATGAKFTEFKTEFERFVNLLLSE